MPTYILGRPRRARRSPYDTELRNKIITENGEVVEELGKRQALDRLVPFLDSEDAGLRVYAACALLKALPARTLPILEAAAAKPGPFQNAASMVLTMRRYPPP